MCAKCKEQKKQRLEVGSRRCRVAQVRFDITYVFLAFPFLDEVAACSTVV